MKSINWPSLISNASLVSLGAAVGDDALQKSALTDPEGVTAFGMSGVRGDSM